MTGDNYSLRAYKWLEATICATDSGTSTSIYNDWDCYTTTSNATTAYGSGDGSYKQWIRGIQQIERVYRRYGGWRNSTSATTCSFYDDNYFENGWTSTCYHESPPKPPTPSERLREILAQRHAPLIIATRKSLELTTDIREMRARETLRRVIGEQKYFDFLKKGFVCVRAKSGLTYQIFPGHGITCVYDKGIMVDRLCVVLQGQFPATDSLIMRYLLILNNEDHFRSFAIKHGVLDRKKEHQKIIKLHDEKQRAGESLIEIYESFKKAS